MNKMMVKVEREIMKEISQCNMDYEVSLEHEK